uniref:Secreted protein n=1 Tax=Knipowitschia caucasica TaxID=637954 RepID=A0AAV2K049_KNICA
MNLGLVCGDAEFKRPIWLLITVISLCPVSHPASDNHRPTAAMIHHCGNIGPVIVPRARKTLPHPDPPYLLVFHFRGEMGVQGEAGGGGGVMVKTKM